MLQLRAQLRRLCPHRHRSLPGAVCQKSLQAAAAAWAERTGRPRRLRRRPGAGACWRRPPAAPVPLCRPLPRTPRPLARSRPGGGGDADTQVPGRLAIAQEHRVRLVALYSFAGEGDLPQQAAKTKSVEQSRQCLRSVRACYLHGHRASKNVRSIESWHTCCAAASGVAAAQRGGVASGLRSLAGSAFGARH